MKTQEKNHGLEQAKAQFNTIKEWIIELREAIRNDNEEKREEIEQRIQEDPLSIEIREDWHTVGSNADILEYKILLCWGGPAVQIIGEFKEYKQAESATIQYQDWFTGWSDYILENEEDNNILLEYCNQFYYSE